MRRHLAAMLLAAVLLPVAVLPVAVLLLPCAARAETMSAAVERTIAGLDTAELEACLGQDDPFEATGGFRETLRRIAQGEMTLSAEQLGRMLASRFAAAWTGSLWRITHLIAPALIWGVARRLTGRSGACGQAVCSLLVCAFLTRDLSEHMALCLRTVNELSAGMQSLFPMLLTMMAAVGGAAGTAVMQPAVASACGALTALIRSVTLPLAAGAAVMTMLCHLGQGIRVERLGQLLMQAAAWSLGLCLTAFIGVLTTKGVTAAAVDGVTIRTAKYALDNFVPMVGGLFADTVDALVGSSVLVQSALGVTGWMLMVSITAGPLCQTFAAAILYKLTAALMQPVADGELAACIHDFSGVLMLLFVIQLSAAAMFLLMMGQLIAVSGITIMIR